MLIGNFLLFTFLCIVPAAERSWFFMIVFGITNGPLAWAVVTFHNCLVFHSLDKITSCFLHITPMAVSWCVRWHLQEDFDVCEPGDSTGSGFYECDTFGSQALHIVGGACAFFFCHQICYYIVIQLCCMNCNENFTAGKDKAGQDSYWTSFRWLTKNKESTMAKV